MHLFKYLIFMGLSVSAFTLVLYLPIILHSGFRSIFGNGFIQPREMSVFWETLTFRLRNIFKSFSGTLPPIIACCLWAGIILAILFPKCNTSKEKISYGLSVGLWTAVCILIQRPELLPRVFLFFHPLLLIYAASGLLGISTKFHIKKISNWILISLVSVMAVSQFVHCQNEIGIIGNQERGIQAIIEREGKNVENILFVTAPGDNAQNWAYAEIYDLPQKIFDKRVAFNTVYVYVNPLDISDYGREPKTLDEMLSKYGPGNNFINRKSIEILIEEPDCILYRFEGRENAIQKAYGEYPAFPD